MDDVASTSAAHDGDANAAVIRTRLVVARYFAVMRIKKSSPADRRPTSRTRDELPRHRGQTRRRRNWFDWGFREALRRRHQGRGTRPRTTVDLSAPGRAHPRWRVRAGGCRRAVA